MNLVRSMALAAMCAAVALAAARVSGEAPAEGTIAPGGLAWQTALDPALEEARQSGEPVVLIFGAPWCEWCRKLSLEIAKPEVQGKLGHVVRVYLDFDKNREAAKRYGVGPIPAIRVLRSNGRVAAVQDGFLPGERLVAFLDDAKKTAAAANVEVLISDDAPSAETIKQIVAAFGSAEARDREAAIRRLLPYPGQAAPAVVESFRAGPLAARLTALDLLDAWKAPIEKLDPWRPESITKERVEALAAWAKNPGAAKASTVLDASQLADARALIDSFLAAPDEDALAVRERLARYGPALLPTVFALLKNPPADTGKDADAVKERLTQLRYRLACSEALALEWPTGLERLSSSQMKVRHSALEELGKRATAKDAPLLLQLFSDSDPLVRETALRLLQAVGGPGAVDALAQLLKDPDQNVRAAVLKSIEVQPTASAESQVADYVAGETDPDLLVHAARVLRKAKGDTPIKALYALLGNENWRVRAEAAEALTEMAGNRSSASNEVKADFLVHMSNLLDDPDGFVASKAMLALDGADVVPDVKKIAAAAGRHPELAALGVKIIASSMRTGGDASKAGVELIRPFANHKDANVRAATVTELTSAIGAGARDTLAKALKDDDATVRTAAMGAIFAQLETLYPSSDNDSVPVAPVPAKAQGPVGSDVFLAGFFSGKASAAGVGRPAWLNAYTPDLEAALAAKLPEERLSAALCLIALGHREKALGLLEDLVKEQPKFMGSAASGLHWLPWKERAAFFDAMLPAATGEQLGYLARGISSGNDPRSAASLWSILARPQAKLSLASEITSDLRRLLLGSDYRTVDLPAPQKKEATASLNKMLEQGTELQKIVALALFPGVSAQDAAAAAAKLRANEKEPPELRRDAFQIQLSMLQAADAQAQAAAALTGDQPLERKLALDYLTTGGDSIRELRNEIYLSINYSSDGIRTGQPIVPAAPKGVKAETLKPLLASKDKAVAAAAGYLLALLHDRSGFDQLAAFYKTAEDHRAARRMLYRAIAALNDDDLTPLLADIYRDMGKETWEMREFYWTIRSMTGEKCMALRKQMRTEVGMDNLR